MINLLESKNNNSSNNNEENDFLENIINSLQLDIDKIEKEIKNINNQDENIINNQYRNDVDLISLSILQKFDSSTILFDDNSIDNNDNNNSTESNNYDNSNNNDKLIEIQLLNKIFDINKAFDNKKNNINKLIKENELKCQSCILKSKEDNKNNSNNNNNNNNNNVSGSNRKNSGSGSTNVTIGSIRDLSKIQPLTVNEFAEWRSLIDDEVFDLYYLVKELKSKIPSTNNNSTDSPASPILSGKTRNKDLYLYNNTFTNILQLKNDLVNIIQNPFFKNNDNRIKNKNNELIPNISDTSLKVTDLSDNSSNNNNNNNNNNSNNGSNNNNNNKSNSSNSNEIIPSSSKSAPNSPNSRRKNIKQSSSPNLSPPGSPLRGRANSAERSPSLSSLPTVLNSNNNNNSNKTLTTNNNNNSTLNNNSSTSNINNNNNVDINNNTTTPTKQPIINKPIQKVHNKNNSPLLSPTNSNSNNNIVVASPNKTTNYYYKLTELDQEKCEDEIKAWIQNILGIDLCQVGPHLPNSSPLSHHLRSGVILCQVINQLRPNSIKKINLAPTPFYQMENIAQFLRVCESVGVDKRDLFHSLDLYEMRNMKSVVATIYALAKSTQRLDDLKNSIYLYSSFNQQLPPQQPPITPTKQKLQHQ